MEIFDFFKDSIELEIVNVVVPYTYVPYLIFIHDKWLSSNEFLNEEQKGGIYAFYGGRTEEFWSIFN